MKKKENKILDDNLLAAFAQLNDLTKTALGQFMVEIEEIIENNITDNPTITNLMERMLDFCHDQRVLKQYKKLCRYYWYIDPHTTADYINLYRTLWDNENEEPNHD
jgi:hypothetical protein